MPNKNTLKFNQQLQEAFALHSKGELQKARALYERLLKTETKSFDLLHYLGSLHTQLKEPIKGIEYLKEALEINPCHLESLSNLGSAYREVREYDLAAQYYQKAIDINPKFANAIVNYANLLFEKES